ncbi:MAG: hypothetical protein EA359_05785 [Balneolaceae bacterium]|nr:MAG: hypothetical protein EA359_05785 [Balneolaceae bacterium]
MKSNMLIISIIVMFAVFGIISCDTVGGGSGSSSTNPIGGNPTPIGEVGNTFTVPAIPGTSDRSFRVVEQDGATSVIQFSATVTNPALLQVANYRQSFSVNGNEVSGSMKFRITSKGVQSFTSDGKPFTLVEYDAKKGDKYTLKRSGKPDLVRRVVHKSTDNDFYWGFMNIRTIQVEETGIASPGVSKIKYYFNHRFGLVGMDVFFEDGSEMLMWVYSDNDN